MSNIIRANRFLQSGANTVSRTTQEKQREGMLPTPQDFGGDGGTGNGFDSTAAINRLLVRAADTKLREIFLPGDFMFDPSAIKWQGRVKIKLQGNMRLMSRMILPTGISLDGEGGDSNLQFQTGTASAITSLVPGDVLVIRGTERNLKNLAIYAQTGGTGLRIDGANALTANVRMENVGIIAAANDVTSTPCIIDAAFWIWFKSCSILSNGLTGTDSCTITNTNIIHSNSGLIYFEDTIFAGRTLRVKTDVNVGRGGDLMLTNCHFESLLEAAITLDATNMNDGLSVVRLSNVNSSDSLSGTIIIKAIGKVKDVSILASDYSIVEGFIDGLEVEVNAATNYIGASPQASVEALPNMISKHHGEIKARSAYRAFDEGFSAQRGYINYANQDISAGIKQSVTIETGLPAPDGSVTAYRINATTAVGVVQPLNGNVTLANGDHVIFGSWVRANDNVTSRYLQDSISCDKLGGSNTTLTSINGVSGNLQNAFTYADHELGYGWGLTVGAFNVEVSTAPEVCAFVMGMRAYLNKPYLAWKPFFIVIPAALGLTKREIIRLANNIGKIVPSVPAGSVALHAHQKAYFGSDVGMGRSAENVLSMETGDSLAVDGTWNGGMFRLGTNYLWVDGVGKLRIKNGLPANDIDGVIVGLQA